jgi:hypothetical protein
MAEFVEVGRGVYLLVVVLGAVSIASLGLALTLTNNRLDDQAQRVDRQLKLIEAALIAECHTRVIVHDLTQQTILLLLTQKQTPAIKQTIRVFSGYVHILSDQSACMRLEQEVSK